MHKYLLISRLESSRIARRDRCSETNDGLAGSITLEKRNIALPGNAWSFGLDRNPNRFRMDHGVPPTRITSFGRASGVRRERVDEFRVTDIDGWSRRTVQPAACAFVLMERIEKKKKKKCMHPFIRAFVTDPSGGFVTSVNRDGFLTASMIYDPQKNTQDLSGLFL